MNWEAIGAIGETIGAIAVVITLVYLAAQIRQNTKTSKAATRQAISDSITAPALNYYQDSEFRTAYNDNIRGKDLDRNQLLHLHVFCYLNYRLWENVHYQYRNGMLSEEEWAALRRNLKGAAQVPVWKENWENESAAYTEIFQKEMNSIFSELESEPTFVPNSIIHPNDS